MTGRGVGVPVGPDPPTLLFGGAGSKAASVGAGDGVGEAFGADKAAGADGVPHAVETRNAKPRNTQLAGFRGSCECVDMQVKPLVNRPFGDGVPRFRRGFPMEHSAVTDMGAGQRDHYRNTTVLH